MSPLETALTALIGLWLCLVGLCIAAAIRITGL